MSNGCFGIVFYRFTWFVFYGSVRYRLVSNFIRFFLITFVLFFGLLFIFFESLFFDLFEVFRGPMVLLVSFLGFFDVFIC